MFIIRVYGESCNYYVSTPEGSCTLRMQEAYQFKSAIDAQTVGISLFRNGAIGHWEVKTAAPKFFPCVS